MCNNEAGGCWSIQPPSTGAQRASVATLRSAPLKAFANRDHSPRTAPASGSLSHYTTEQSVSLIAVSIRGVRLCVCVSAPPRPRSSPP